MSALMHLESYNSSDSDDSDEIHVGEKKVERLPVPEFLVSSSKSKVNVKEQNEDGKIRNFPHEPGIWATYVYISVKTFYDLLDYLESLKQFLKPWKLNTVDDFHVSLTRTVILKHHWIHDFTVAVRKSLMDICCFHIYLSDLEVYLNEGQTRTFLSLIVKEGAENLITMVNRLDQCLKEYNLEPFYKEPSFHLSLLWCSGNKRDEIKAALNELPLDLKSFGFHTNVSHCNCTSGPYFLTKDDKSRIACIVQIIFNLILIGSLIYNMTGIVNKEWKAINHSRKNLVWISYGTVDMMENLHHCFVSLRSIIFLKNGHSLWISLKRVNKNLKDLNVEFNGRSFKLYLYFNAFALILFYVVFLEIEINLFFVRSGNGKSTISRIFHIVPLLLNAIVEVAFDSLTLILYQRFWAINEFLRVSVERYKCEKSMAPPKRLDWNEFTNRKTIDFSFVKNLRKENKVGVDHFKKFHRGKSNWVKPPILAMVKNGGKSFRDHFRRKNSNSDLIRSLKSIHFELYEIAVSLNSAFGWNLFFIFATSFFGCIINLYFVINFKLKKYDVVEYVSLFSWMIYYLFRIFHVIACSNKSSKEASLTLDFLHLFLNQINFTDSVLQGQLKEFCLQVCKCPVQFSAAGFFTIDFGTLFNFVAGVLSNVVFIIQFKETNEHEDK